MACTHNVNSKQMIVSRSDMTGGGGGGCGGVDTLSVSFH